MSNRNLALIFHDITGTEPVWFKISNAWCDGHSSRDQS